VEILNGKIKNREPTVKKGMKQLKIKDKIILSITSIICIIYFIILFSGDSALIKEDFLLFGILIILRIVEQVFLTKKIFMSNFKMEMKITYIILNFSFIIFTPIYVWFIHNKLLKKYERSRRL
jgi:hypothetical protein